VTTVEIDRIADAVLVLDHDGTVIAANSAACRLSGFPRNELEGAACAEILDARDDSGARVWASGWPRSTDLRGVRAIPATPVTIRDKRGKRIPVSVTGSYSRDAGGAVDSLVLSLRDATRASDGGGVEIVSTVSHELRSPLTAVKGYTSLLLNRWERLTDEQKRSMLQQVNNDADRVTRLITELLDISRLETGRLTLRRQLVDLPKLTASVVAKVSLGYPDLDAAVEFPAGFPKVYADPDKVEQVLTNLVENACKYGSPSGMSICGSVGDDAGLVVVTVTDRGEGILQEDLPKVFTKFFHRSEGRPTGSGLGLWISRGLVEAHGGQLSVESIRGQGSSFRFTLPLIDLDELQKA
jgi:hypothetical protein